MTVKASNREKKQRVAPSRKPTQSNPSCEACGQAFAHFLEEMAARNAKQLPELNPGTTPERPAEFTCPKCGKTDARTSRIPSPTVRKERSGNLTRN
jgi:hypothetical protein